jgi:NADPH-dependent curcumin reductase CurA
MENDIHARRIVLAARPAGVPRPADFRLEERAVPPLDEGKLLIETLWLSLDPYMRGRMDDRKSYAKPVPIGGVMEGEVVGRVVASRHPGFKDGDLVHGRTGWQSHAVTDGSDIKHLDKRIEPVTAALGVLGMPGITAYGGLLEIGKPKPGETVVVAAATGPVGSMVGQIARIKSARAVGIAGGPDKCEFARRELGFDAVVDHRAPDFPVRLAASCPAGIDVYFENVGGAVWDAVFPLLNDHARVPICGLVSQYNGATTRDSQSVDTTMRAILTRSLTLRGFIYREFAGLREAFLDDVSIWLRNGRVRYKEDVVIGLENAPAAFVGMLEGRNFGKLLVRVADAS